MQEEKFKFTVERSVQKKSKARKLTDELSLQKFYIGDGA